MDQTKLSIRIGAAEDALTAYRQWEADGTQPYPEVMGGLAAALELLLQAVPR